MVAQQPLLLDICERCEAAGSFAFDTEFVMEDRFEPEVCVIQMATKDMVAIVDPMAGLDSKPVWDLVRNPSVETIVHAGQEDLALCAQHTGEAPRNIFDVQIAVGLIGHSYPLSLQKLVQAIMHIRLHKSKTLTDWRKRPLTPAQIRYAAEDVEYLPAVRDRIGQRLDKLGRRDWATEEMTRFERLELYQPAEEERVFRAKGAGNLKGQQLAVVQAILAWREKLARRLNRPARVALRDHLLVEIAKHGINTPGEIRELRGINLRAREITEVCGVVTKALQLPSSEWPKAKPQDVEGPHEAEVTSLVTAIIRSRCREIELAYPLTATAKSIRQLVRHLSDGQPNRREDVELLRRWRGQAVGTIVEQVLTGQHTVRVERHDESFTVRVVEDE